MSDEIKNILKSSKVIAVVGISAKPGRASGHVAEYLRDHGYKIIPVNPQIEIWQGMKVYPDLKSVPDKIDIVDIFRKPAEIPPIVEEAISVGAKVVWMQLGIVNDEAAARARDAGLKVVMNRCTLIEHQKLLG